MSRAGSRALVGAATLVVASATIFAVSVGDWVVAGSCLLCGIAVAVGWVIVRHEPSSPVGPALAWTTACVALVTGHVGPLATVPWAGGFWPVNLADLLALLLVFPSGPPAGRGWRAVPWAFGAATVGMVAAQWGATQIDGRVTGGPQGAWTMPVVIVCVATVALCLIAGAASLIVRYRRGGDRERQQIRWLILAGLVVVVLLVAGWGLQASGVAVDVAYAPLLLAIVLLVPAAVGIAIVRYDLFDVDRLLSDTTAWVFTLLLSAGVFGVVGYVAGRVVAVGPGLGSAVAAFVTALAILPLQRYVTAWVGRLVDRDRHVAVAAVERFAADVRAGRREPEEIEDVLREAQQDAELDLQLALPGGGWGRLDGTAVASPSGVAVEARGDVIARIRLGWESARARRRIHDLARAAWVPIEVSRLRLGLRNALGEVEASRGRLLEATMSERRRLERDLHDGAQQRIVATGMRPRLLQERLAPAEAAEVNAAVAELRDTVDALRRIANGIRPAQLDDGLAPALAALQAACPIPVDLDVADLPEVGEVRTLTAYLLVSEALANALKHAHATRLGVRLTGREDRLVVEVSDDGVGGVPGDAALPALTDRVLAVGGSLTVHSPPGTGTTITAVI